jgi:hypothetical protein
MHSGHDICLLVYVFPYQSLSFPQVPLARQLLHRISQTKQLVREALHLMSEDHLAYAVAFAVCCS